jgi:phosphoglycolate phosphatase
VHGPDLDGTRADKGELIEHVLRVEGLPATDTWMIGDRLHDIVGASANRVPGIGVLWGYGSRDELAEAGADPIVGSMPELVAHIGRVGEKEV